MSVNRYDETIPASGQTQLSPGNFLFLLACSALVELDVYTKGSVEKFQGLSAGLQLNRLKGWDRVTVIGAAGTTFSVFYGYETAREDQTLFQTQIAVIAGGSILASLGLGSPNGLTSHADVSVGATSTDTTIPANALRKSIQIGSLSTNAPAAATGSLRIGPHPYVSGGVELQAGTNETLNTQAAIDIRNPDANAQSYWWVEQT